MQDDTHQNLDMRGMISFRLARVQARMSAQSAQILRDNGGLSVMQWRVLFMVDALGCTTPAEIVRQTGLDKGQLSRAIKNMVSTGLLTSKTSQDDQRALLIDFSDRGRKLFLRVRPTLYRRQDLFRGCLTEDELETFLTVLGKLETAMDDYDAEIR